MTDQDATHEHQVLRYQRAPRLVHALLASSFMLLLLSGFVLLWQPLGFLAAGGTSRWLHRVGAVGFMAVPFAYLASDRRGAKELIVDSFHFDKDDRAWLLHIGKYAFGRAAGMPPQGRLNAGQKLHHATVVLVSAIIVATGLVMWFLHPGLGSSTHALVAIIHDLAMLVLVLLLIGHLYFTYVYGALSGMTSGYIDEDEARLEHPKWVEELQAVGATQSSEQVQSGETSHSVKGNNNENPK